MIENWKQPLRSLLDAPSPAVLTTYRKDGTAVASPVWFRFHDDAFEVVIGEDDVKLRHLGRRPECSLVVFETVAPFRGVRVEGMASLRRDGGTEVRAAIARRYLGAERGQQYVEQRRPAAVVLRLEADRAHAWDLSAILPTG